MLRRPVPRAVAGPVDRVEWSQLVIAPDLDPLTRQVLGRDLGQFPTPWLKFLQGYGLQVVVLQEGQTLADSPAMSKNVVSNLSNWTAQVKRLVSEAFVQSPPTVEELQAWLEEQHIPFRAASHSSPVDLQQLAEQRQIAPAFRQQWVKQLLELNEPWSSVQDGKLCSQHGVFLLPPAVTAFGPVADLDYQSAVSTTASSVEASLGLNRGAEQRVLLHSRFLGDGAPEIGDYRVAIHEVGHALDYALEGLPDESGFGQRHKAKVLACFEGSHDFTSDRARDNPREFFAESVEAYLTPPSSHFDFRPDNHQASLRQRNPDMATYLDGIFATVPAPEWKSQPPEPQRLPAGFPDPDRDPIYLA